MCNEAIPAQEQDMSDLVLLSLPALARFLTGNFVVAIDEHLGVADLRKGTLRDQIVKVDARASTLLFVALGVG